MLIGRQWEERQPRTKRGEPEVHGCPKRAAEGNFCHFLSEAWLLSALLNNCFTIYQLLRCECNDNILFSYGAENIFSKSIYHLRVLSRKCEEGMCHIRGRCVCVEDQILSLEIDGSARDRLAFDQSAATDISTYAGWIIKNTSDPLWRSKLLLLLHSHMQYVSSGCKVEVIFY